MIFFCSNALRDDGMKVVLQRVSRASVAVDGQITGQIDNGYLILVGFGEGDNTAKVEKMADKIQKLRIFPDVNGKTNRSIHDVGGGVLVVSQFTLYADCRKGNRPSFMYAADPAVAEGLYDYFIRYANGLFDKVAHGVFGAEMKVELVNDGPFTLILDD